MIQDQKWETLFKAMDSLLEQMVSVNFEKTPDSSNLIGPLEGNNSRYSTPLFHGLNANAHNWLAIVMWIDRNYKKMDMFVVLLMKI